MNKPKSKFHIERQHWTKQQKVYKLHKAGKSFSQIADIMGYDNSFIKGYSEILSFLQSRYDDSFKSTTKPPHRPKGITKIQITTFEIERIKCMAMLGRTQRDIAKFLNIDETTLCKYKKMFPKLKEAIDDAKEEMVQIAIDALIKRAKGYKFKDVIHASYKGHITTQEVDRVLHPSIQAAQLILVNKENWRSGNTAEVAKDDQEAKGRILDFLEKAKES